MDISDFDGFVKTWMDRINGEFGQSFKLLELNPFNDTLNIGSGVESAVNGVALTLVSLFFVMQFCNDAMYLKLNNYENIFKLIFKFFLAKSLVDNARGIMGIIYNSFTNVSLAIADSTKNILSSFSTDAIVTKPSDPGIFNINYGIAEFQSLPTFIILWGATLVISLILIGRLFEVIIYTTVAPIPLATFASEGWTDSAKTFIKGYAAVCLQSLIIIMMFNSFNGISQLMSGGGNALSMTITALALATGVTKSGQWARTAVGLG